MADINLDPLIPDNSVQQQDPGGSATMAVANFDASPSGGSVQQDRITLAHIPGEDDIDLVERRRSNMSLRTPFNSTGSENSPGSGSSDEGAIIALGPLTSFELFRRLPMEIRLMIWRRATLHPRIIEMQAENLPDDIIRFFGNTAAATIVSSEVPSMLHVNQEAREEGLKFYTLRVFSTSRTRAKLMYFNNQIDVLLFGEGCRASGLMKKVFQECTTVDLPIERIAIAMEEIISHQKLLDMMREIHGLTGGTGCFGVKEITFVPPTKLWGSQPGNIDRKWALVPTANGGLNYHHLSIRRMIEQITRVLATNTVGLWGPLSTWVRSTGADKPVFSYASLRPIGGEGNKTRDGFSVCENELWTLTRHDSHILKAFEKMFGIQIEAPVSTLPIGDLVDVRCKEIGIVGENRFQVEKGMDAIEKFLVHVQTLGPEDLE